MGYANSTEIMGPVFSYKSNSNVGNFPASYGDVKINQAGFIEGASSILNYGIPYIDLVFE